MKPAKQIVDDDLPYRIVEAMGLGYIFRACGCGQLPCARLQPIRDALNAERERCAKIVNDARSEGGVDLRELVSRIRSNHAD